MSLLKKAASKPHRLSYNRVNRSERLGVLRSVVVSFGFIDY